MLKFTLYITFLFLLSSCCSYKFNRTDSEGNKNGKWIVRNANDSLDFSIVTYSKNVLDGQSIEYYENGIIAKGEYHDNYKVGEWKVFDNNQKVLIKKMYYTEGFLSRIEIIENGKVVRQAITGPPF